MGKIIMASPKVIAVTFDQSNSMKNKYNDVSVIILAEAALVYPKEQRVSLVRDQLILVFH